MISILMPFYNRYDLVMRRMLEIHTNIHHPADMEIVLINNGSRPGSIEEGNIFYWQKMVGWFPVKYLKWETNVGFGGAFNRAIPKSEGDILILLSDDVIIKGNFIPQIESILNQDLTALVGGETIYWAAGWNQFDVAGKPVVITYANGWLLACRRSTWEESGGFDPQYYPYDYEDMDLSMRWHEMGYPIIPLNSQYVSHIGGATIGAIDSDRMATTEKHRQLFISKWYEKLLMLSDSEVKSGADDK